MSTDKKNLEERIKAALDELKEQEEAIQAAHKEQEERIQAIYKEQFEQVKNELSQSLKENNTTIIHVLSEIEETEKNYNKELNNLLTILETEEKAKNSFPSETLYNRYLGALRKAIAVSDKVLDVYSKEFQFVSTALASTKAKKTVILPSTAEILQKLNNLTEIIVQEFPAVFEHIELSDRLQKTLTPEQAEDLKTSVYSHKASGRKDFDTHSILTVQRLPRYKLLFETIGKNLKTYENIQLDYEDFKQYLSTKAKPIVKDSHALSEQEIKDHLVNYFKSKVGYKNEAQIEKVAAIAQAVNKVMGIAATPTMNTTAEPEELGKKQSMLTRFKSLNQMPTTLTREKSGTLKQSKRTKE